MAQNKLLGKKRRERWHLQRGTVMIAAAVVLLAAVFAIPKGSPVRSFFQLLIQPAQSLFWPKNPDATTVEQLRQQLAALEVQQQIDQQKLAQAEELAAQAGFALQHPDHDWLSARIVARDPGAWFIQFTLNKGTNDGVSQDDMVLTPQGIVGRVVQVDSGRCQVMALVDVKNNISCMVARTRDACMAAGQLQSGLEDAALQLQYLGANADVQVGDRLLSSGLDGLYPPGFSVGVITAVRPASDTAPRVVSVAPAVNFQALSQVLILRNTAALME